MFDVVLPIKMVKTYMGVGMALHVSVRQKALGLYDNLSLSMRNQLPLSTWEKSLWWIVSLTVSSEAVI